MAVSASGRDAFRMRERIAWTAAKVTAELEEEEGATTDVEARLRVNSSHFYTDAFNEVSGGGDEEEEAAKWKATVTCDGEDGSTSEASTEDQLVLVLRGLTPNTEYSCGGTFAVETGKGAARSVAHVNPVHLKTKKKVPGQPIALEGETLTSGPDADQQYLQLSWQEPAEGHIEEYQVAVEATCVNGGVEECAELCSSLGRTHLTAEPRLLLRIGPSVSYAVTVRARTDNPEFGPASRPFTFSSTAVLRAPVVTKVSAGRQGNSLAVAFAPPCPPPPSEEGKAEPGVTYSARVRCNGCNSFQTAAPWRRRKVQRVPGANRFVISGLEGGHYYDVWVDAVDNSCSGGDGGGGGRSGRSHGDSGTDGADGANNSSSCVASSLSQVVFLDCEFRCSDGTCVNRGDGWRSIRCDFVQDCPDGSDEAGCACDPPEKFRYLNEKKKKANRVVFRSNFHHFFVIYHLPRCDSGYCIRSENRCDGKIDCNDLSDEKDCPTCNREQFRCEKSGRISLFFFFLSQNKFAVSHR